MPYAGPSGRAGFFLVALVAAAVLAALRPADARSLAAVDAYVLALSWSPTYCLSDEGGGDRHQCDARRDYGFVVHGLWPVAAAGSLDYCDVHDRWLPEDVIRGNLDLIPSRGLIIHEWKRHGTCSGLGQRGYFALIRTLAGRLAIPTRYQIPLQPIETTPAALIDAFVAANPRLDPDMLVVRCKRKGSRFSELRICYDGQGRESRCPARLAQGNCRGTITLPAAP
jgi:ribonuclease T2